MLIPQFFTILNFYVTFSSAWTPQFQSNITLGQNLISQISAPCNTARAYHPITVPELEHSGWKIFTKPVKDWDPIQGDRVDVLEVSARYDANNTFNMTCDFPGGHIFAVYAKRTNPHLPHWSNVTMALWVNISADIYHLPLSGLRKITQLNVINGPTLALLDEIYTVKKWEERRGRIDVDVPSDEFHGLMWGANARMVGFILLQHQKALGGLRTIAQMTIFKGWRMVSLDFVFSPPPPLLVAAKAKGK